MLHKLISTLGGIILMASSLPLMATQGSSGGFGGFNDNEMRRGMPDRDPSTFLSNRPDYHENYMSADVERQFRISDGVTLEHVRAGDPPFDHPFYRAEQRTRDKK